MTEESQDQPILGAFGIFDILGFKHRMESTPLTILRDRVVGALVLSAIPTIRTEVVEAAKISQIVSGNIS
jgi:hypothetical protein